MAVFKCIGAVGVDSGNVWVGDPCYIKRDFNDQDQWMDFTSPRYPSDRRYVPHADADGGVLCGTTHGDGLYPVYVLYNDDGYPRAIMVDFDDAVIDGNLEYWEIPERPLPDEMDDYLTR